MFSFLVFNYANCRMSITPDWAIVAQRKMSGHPKTAGRSVPNSAHGILQRLIETTEPS
jgi:hypothetical protein